MFLLGLNDLGTCMPNRNELLTINQPDFLKINPHFFINENISACNLCKKNKYDLHPANNKKQSSKNNIQLLQSFYFIIEEGNLKNKIAKRKTNCGRNNIKPKSISIKPNSGLPKVPP